MCALVSTWFPIVIILYCGKPPSQILFYFLGGVVLVGAICYSTICIGTHACQIAVIAPYVLVHIHAK